jgi:hypothetical protein
MILAGTPATTQLSGISFVTTEFAPIITLLIIPPKHLAHRKDKHSQDVDRFNRFRQKILYKSFFDK